MSSTLETCLARLRDACPPLRLHAPAPSGLLQADIAWDTCPKAHAALTSEATELRVMRQDLLIVRIEHTTVMLSTIPPAIEPARAVAMSALEHTTGPRPSSSHQLEVDTWYLLTTTAFGHCVPTSTTGDILATLLCDTAGVNPKRGASRISVERLLAAMTDQPDLIDTAHALAH